MVAIAGLIFAALSVTLRHSLNMQLTKLRVIIAGRVQGVGFRYSTKELARSFEVCGTVRNLPDGTVEVMVSGTREEVEAFLKELTTESAVAHHIKHVTRQAVESLPHCHGFQIVR
jgi:acylphosphatase